MICKALSPLLEIQADVRRPGPLGSAAASPRLRFKKMGLNGA